MLDLQSMTVLSLRKLAREKGVKLSAGLDKEGIIARIASALGQASQVPDQPDAAFTAAPAAQEEAAEETSEETSIEENEKPAGMDDGTDAEANEEEESPVITRPAAQKPADSLQYKPAWTNPQYSRSSTGPVYSTKPAWQARSISPASRNTPVMRQETMRPAPAPRPAGYSPRFGPDAPDTSDTMPPVQTRFGPAASTPPARRDNAEQEQDAIRPAPRQEAYRPAPQDTFRPAQQEPSYTRPAQRSETLRPAYRQDNYREDAYRQDNFRGDAPSSESYRPEPYRQENYRQEPYRTDNYRDPTFRSEALRPEPIRQETYFRPRRDTGYYNRELGTSNPAVPEMLATGECGDGSGILEIHPEGYGFLRAENFLPGSKDVYVSIAQIRRFGLRTGDHIVGKTRPQREGDKYSALLYITEVNGIHPDELRDRVAFDDLTPVYPSKRITLENSADNTDLAIRLVDLIAPIGFGQRALIVAPPKAGKTTILSKIANAITRNYPDVHVMVLLVDERPEEVTDLRESIAGEVLASTFDEMPENHIRLAEMVLERAQRLVEQKKDVVVLMDSITRLSRAYNAVAPQTGRAMSGGLAPGVLHKPKRFFGAARNVREGGSLTVIATALIETGSRMDDIIFEEFKGTGNMELVLDRELSEKRVFPAVNLQKSGTRREDLLLNQKELDGIRSIRGVLSSANAKDATEQLLSMMEKTKTNNDLFAKLQDWITMWEKSGFVLQR